MTPTPITDDPALLADYRAAKAEADRLGDLCRRNRLKTTADWHRLAKAEERAGDLWERVFVRREAALAGADDRAVAA